MTELIWLNGKVMPLADAKVGVEDRGFQFADGVYEVIRVYNGVPFAMAGHMERFERSCAAIGLTLGMPRQQMADEMRALIHQSNLREGMIYAQITRGECHRNHVYPCGLRPTVLFHTRDLPPVPAPGSADGVTLHSVIDERWHKCWIKSIALLPNILAKNQAVAAGADEAIFIYNSNVTEGSATNFYIINQGRLITHPVGEKVLPGITRDVLLQLAPTIGLKVEERPISETEAKGAEEQFITSTTREISWVKAWNNQPVGPGQCGPWTLKLHQAFAARVGREVGR